MSLKPSPAMYSHIPVMGLLGWTGPGMPAMLLFRKIEETGNRARVQARVSG